MYLVLRMYCTTLLCKNLFPKGNGSSGYHERKEKSADLKDIFFGLQFLLLVNFYSVQFVKVRNSKKKKKIVKGISIALVH
jgi:hypothetical protein